MELRAIYEALRHYPPDQPLLILADSQYSINACTKWIHGWRRRGWQTADRKPVKNQAAIIAIDELLTGRDVRWEYVKGHAGHPLNELVDGKARDAATASQNGAPVDQGPLAPIET
jgi:ribonuclease HI